MLVVVFTWVSLAWFMLITRCITFMAVVRIIEMNSTTRLPFLIVALLVVLMSGHETSVKNDAASFVVKKVNLVVN